MKMSWCDNCGKKTGHKISTSFATLFAVVLTLGFWLLLLPFYPRRCIICGATGSSGSLLLELLGWAVLIWMFFHFIGK